MKICKTCKYWYNTQNGYGSCASIEQRRWLTTHNQQPPPTCYLTEAGFTCKQWRRKMD